MSCWRFRYISGEVDFNPFTPDCCANVENKHLANVLSGHLQMKSVQMQMRCGVRKDNETACKKVRNYVFKKKRDPAMTHLLAE